MECANQMIFDDNEKKQLFNNEFDKSFEKVINSCIDEKKNEDSFTNYELEQSIDKDIISEQFECCQKIDKSSFKNDIIEMDLLVEGKKDILFKAVTRLEKVQISKLLLMIKNNEENEIKSIILSGIPNLINYSDMNHDYTPLGLACKLNLDLIVDLLLVLGASVNAKDCQAGSTALMQAVKYGHQESVIKLLDKNADVNIRDFKGETALFYAIEATKRHEKIIKILLESGADTNIVNYDGTPLIVSACEKAQYAYMACNILINHGVEINAKDMKTGRTALMSAAYSGSFNVCNSLLLAGSTSDDILNVFKSTALHDAASRGHLRVIQVLSGYNAQLNATNWHGNTALHVAAASNQTNVCKFLAQRGCNPKKKNRAGLIAREVAKNGSMLESSKECLKAERIYGKVIKNAEKWRLKIYDFICANEENLYALAKPSAPNNISKDDLIDYIISKCGNNFKENNIKKTLSVFKEKTISIRDLISGKKYVNKKFILPVFIKVIREIREIKKGGKQALIKDNTVIPICVTNEGRRVDNGIVENKNFLEIFNHITDEKRFKNDACPDNPFQDDSLWYINKEEAKYQHLDSTILRNDIPTLNRALVSARKRDIVSTKDKFYKTPLMVACMRGDLTLAQTFIENGADVNAVDNFKWTPLHFACFVGFTDLVEYLIDKGASVNAVALNGATPILRAIQSSNQDVVNLLINKGAKIEVENGKGTDPLELAADFSNYETFEIIRREYLKAENADKKKKSPSKCKPNARSQSVPPPKNTPKSVTPPPATNCCAPENDVTYFRPPMTLANSIIINDTWGQQKTKSQILHSHETRRKRFGWESDFRDFKLPFMKNVANKIQPSATFCF